MRLKEMVMEMLQRSDHRGLEELVVEQPRAIRYLQGRLWDSEERVRQNAAEALGAAAATHPELGTEILRRAMWALNDESATNGAPMLLAIGEIGGNCPDLVAPFVGPMTALLWDDSLRPGILRALCRIAEAAPELIEGVHDRLEAYENSGDSVQRTLIGRLLEGSVGGVNGA
jgi:HEAT repeat protein